MTRTFQRRKFYVGQTKKSFNFSLPRLFITCKGMLIDDFTCWNKHPRYTVSLPLIIPPSKEIAPSFSPRLEQCVDIVKVKEQSRWITEKDIQSWRTEVFERSSQSII